MLTSILVTLMYLFFCIFIYEIFFQAIPGDTLKALQNGIIPIDEIPDIYQLVIYNDNGIYTDVDNNCMNALIYCHLSLNLSF